MTSKGIRAAAIHPLTTSMTMTQMPKAKPCVRSAFVLPGLPLPSLRMSTPPRRRPITRLPTTEPSR